MSVEIPFDIKDIPDQAHEIAIRYAYLSQASVSIDPLQRYLVDVAAIPKFEAVAIKLMSPTLQANGILILTAMRRIFGRKKERFDMDNYMSKYYELRNAVNSSGSGLEVTPMFIHKDKHESPKDIMRSILEHFFEPSPLNLGYHPVDPHSDALPVATLAVVNRRVITSPTILGRINSASVGLLDKETTRGVVLN